jgi:hypothetical protein
LLRTVVVKYKMRQWPEAVSIAPCQNHAPAMLFVSSLMPFEFLLLKSSSSALNSIQSCVTDELLLRFLSRIVTNTMSHLSLIAEHLSCAHGKSRPAAAKWFSVLLNRALSYLEETA